MIFWAGLRLTARLSRRVGGVSRPLVFSFPGRSGVGAGQLDGMACRIVTAAVTWEAQGHRSASLSRRRRPPRASCPAAEKRRRRSRFGSQRRAVPARASSWGPGQQLPGQGDDLAPDPPVPRAPAAPAAPRCRPGGRRPAPPRRPGPRRPSLHVTPDGMIGPVTVKALQARVGATQDGQWGPLTTEAMQRALNAGRF
jgi:hypothetical protein